MSLIVKIIGLIFRLDPSWSQINDIGTYNLLDMTFTGNGNRGHLCLLHFSFNEKDFPPVAPLHASFQVPLTMTEFILHDKGNNNNNSSGIFCSSCESWSLLVVSGKDICSNSLTYMFPSKNIIFPTYHIAVKFTICQILFGYITRKIFM